MSIGPLYTCFLTSKMKIIIEFAPRSCHENIGDNICKESIKAPSTLLLVMWWWFCMIILRNTEFPTIHWIGPKSFYWRLHENVAYIIQKKCLSAQAAYPHVTIRKSISLPSTSSQPPTMSTTHTHSNFQLLLQTNLGVYKRTHIC